MDPIKQDPILRIIRHIVVIEYRKMLAAGEAICIAHGPTHRGGYHAEITVELWSSVWATMMNLEFRTGTISIHAKDDQIEIAIRLVEAFSKTELTSYKTISICNPDSMELLKNAITEYPSSIGTGQRDTEMAISSQIQA